MSPTIYVVLESTHKRELPNSIFKLKPDLLLVEYGNNDLELPKNLNLKIKYFGGDTVTETKAYEKNLLQFILKNLDEKMKNSGLEKVCIIIGEKHIGICAKLEEKGEVYIYRTPKITPKIAC